MISEENETPWHAARIYKIATFVTAILVLIGLLFTQGIKVLEYFNPWTSESWTVALSFLNLIVLILFFFVFSKNHELKFRNKEGDADSGIKHYSALLHVMSNGSVEGVEKAKWYNERVNNLVKQLNSNIVWYILFLIPVFSLSIFDTTEHPWHSYFKVAKDVFNYMSFLFIYLSFLVLYNNTLDKKNNSDYRKNKYFLAAIIFTIGYFIAYACFGFHCVDAIKSGDAIKSDTIISNRFSLISGMVNGLAMSLLFARYISMGHAVQNNKKIKYFEIVTVGMIYLLPVYAIVQPLFGAFYTTEYGKSENIINTVFAVALVGKLFFLYVTWLFMQRKLMHLYLHMVITPRNVANGYETCF